MRTAVGTVVALLTSVSLVSACSTAQEPREPPTTPPPASDAPGPGAATTTGPAVGGTPSGTSGPARRPWVRAGDLSPDLALAVVRQLAGRIGPRPAPGAGHRRAERWVAGRLASWGYDVRREAFDVPAGVSWGVPVPAGRAANVVATPPGFDPARPYLLVGAHLDTVPQAPGAEDNASGVGVLLAVAEAIAGRRTRLPLVLVAFGAEEPRGPGDDAHHFGSRHHVASLSARARRSLRGMVSLDRVGVGTRLPVCSAAAPDRSRAVLLSAARRAGVQTVPCEGNRASDHWSFARAGLSGTRLGSTSYAAYHSAADVPGVVDRAQLRRAGRTVLAWLGRG